VTRHPRRGARTDALVLDEALMHRSVADRVYVELADAFTKEIDRQVMQHGGTQRFEVLHYPGDLTDRILAGQVLGADEFGRPFEVLDVERQKVPAPGHYFGDDCAALDPAHLRVRTEVHLQYATPETLAAGFAQLLGGAR